MSARAAKLRPRRRARPPRESELNTGARGGTHDREKLLLGRHRLAVDRNDEQAWFDPRLFRLRCRVDFHDEQRTLGERDPELGVLVQRHRLRRRPRVVGKTHFDRVGLGLREKGQELFLRVDLPAVDRDDVHAWLHAHLLGLPARIDAKDLKVRLAHRQPERDRSHELELVREHLLQAGLFLVIQVRRGLAERGRVRALGVVASHFPTRFEIEAPPSLANLAPRRGGWQFRDLA